jgi:hypothetical protein
MEDVFNTQVEGFTEVLGEMNKVNADAIEQYRRFGNELSPFADVLTNFTAEIDILKTKFTTSMTGLITDGTAKLAELFGLRDENQDEINEKNAQTTKETTENLQVAENNKILETDSSGEKSGMLSDNDAKNMFDEITNVLDASGKNVDRRIEVYTKSLVEQLGMFDNDEGFDAAKMADLAKAIEAIQETDAFKTTEGQENLAKMYEALKQMNVDMSSFWTSAKTDRANTEQNANEQQAILGELRKLVKALNEN